MGLLDTLFPPASSASSSATSRGGGRSLFLRSDFSSTIASTAYSASRVQPRTPPLRPRVLHTHEAVRALARHLPPKAQYGMLAFYSSVLGGIVTDPALMVLPIDDHMAHRGHAVFDTANVVGKEGKVYGLDMHLDRLLRSAGLARIKPAFTKQELREIVLATVAAAQEKEGIFVRYWMSAGRGDFSISSKGTSSSHFYVVVHRLDATKAEHKLRGVGEYIVRDIPVKPPLLATIKSNNYLINALTCEAAEDHGGCLGIQLDAQGRVAEGSIGNVAILNPQNVLVTPPFEGILAGTTVQRLWELAGEALVREGLIAGVALAHLTPDDLFTAKEAYSLGGGSVLPIVKIDGKAIGDGKPGPVCKALDALQARDMAADEGGMLDEPPYQHYRMSFLQDAVWRWCKKVVGKLDRDMLTLLMGVWTVAYGAGRVRGQRIYI